MSVLLVMLGRTLNSDGPAVTGKVLAPRRIPRRHVAYFKPRSPTAR